MYNDYHYKYVHAGPNNNVYVSKIGYIKTFTFNIMIIDYDGPWDDKIYVYYIYPVTSKADSLMIKIIRIYEYMRISVWIPYTLNYVCVCVGGCVCVWCVCVGGCVLCVCVCVCVHIHTYIIDQTYTYAFCGARGWPRTVVHDPLNSNKHGGKWMLVISSFCASRLSSRDSTREARRSSCWLLRNSVAIAAPSQQQLRCSSTNTT